jgi:hypothetical protein
VGKNTLSADFQDLQALSLEPSSSRNVRHRLPPSDAPRSERIIGEQWTVRFKSRSSGECDLMHLCISGAATLANVPEVGKLLATVVMHMNQELA